MERYLEQLTAPSRDWLKPALTDAGLGPELHTALLVATQHVELPRALTLARYAVVGKQPVLLGWSALLAACFDDPAAHNLLDRLLRHSDARVRRVALEASQLTESPLALRRAMACTADPDAGVASSALQILEKAGPARLAPLLGQLLDKGDTASVDEAARALAVLRESEYRPLLMRCYFVADVALRRHLAQALRNMGTQEAAEELHLLSQQDPELSGEIRVLRSDFVEQLRQEGSVPVPPAAAPSREAEAPRAPAPPTETQSPPAPAAAPATIRVQAIAPEAAAPEPRQRLEHLLRRLVRLGGSDLHLKAGLPPYLRKEGRLAVLRETPLQRQELLDCMAAACRPDQMGRFQASGDLDLALGLPGVARFRLNYLLSGGQPALVARVIPTEVPDMAKLGLPQVLHELALSTKGLVLVTGPTGSGKSTTLAAMLDLINSVRRGHIITIEDPIEFIHRDKLSSVMQREVGVDVATFADGVRFALRQDPDVLLVGELRDLETVRAAFQAAGAGRLVLGTLHTNSAAKTLERLLNVFPADEQPQARMSLSLTLTGVISQTLVAKPGSGRLAVHEILIASGAVRKAIREKQTQAIYGLMESGSAMGMCTLEQALARLVRAKTVTAEEALSLANEPALMGLL